MEKILDYRSNKEHYRAGAAVVWCYDERFRKAMDAFLESRGISHPDIIKIAGGAKTLASPDKESDRGYLLEQIGKSILLHSTGKALLMTHEDCGAYGGSAKFNDSHSEELSFHKKELAEAKRITKERFPGLDVETVFVGLDGIYSVS